MPGRNSKPYRVFSIESGQFQNYSDENIKNTTLYLNVFEVELLGTLTFLIYRRNHYPKLLVVSLFLPTLVKGFRFFNMTHKYLAATTIKSLSQ